MEPARISICAGRRRARLRLLSVHVAVALGQGLSRHRQSDRNDDGEPDVLGRSADHLPEPPTVTYRVATTTTGTSFTLTTNYTGGNQTGLQITSFSGGCIELVSTSPHGLRRIG